MSDMAFGEALFVVGLSAVAALGGYVLDSSVGYLISGIGVVLAIWIAIKGERGERP